MKLIKVNLNKGEKQTNESRFASSEGASLTPCPIKLEHNLEVF